MNDLKSEVLEIYKQARFSTDGAIENFHFFEEIPDKKIQNIRKKYAKDMDNTELAICLFDDTVFGTANDGLLLTTKRIYAKTMGQKNFSADIKDIIGLKQKFGIINSEIIIKTVYKSYPFTVSQAHGKGSKELLFTTLDQIVKLLKGEITTLLPQKSQIPPTPPASQATGLVMTHCKSCGAAIDSTRISCYYCSSKIN